MQREQIFANAGDEGFGFIFQNSIRSGVAGGIVRWEDQGHLVTIVGRGGTGKSILALQLVTSLLEDAENRRKRWDDLQKPAAFYFTLEASPNELGNQLRQFAWGKKRYGDNEPEQNGLFIIPIPSPTEDLTTVIFQIRQTIAHKLPTIGELCAIVIDPLGGICLNEDLRNELSQLKQLTDVHQTFLFLLCEDHIYDRHPSIEHYAQSIIHLDHSPTRQPSRSIYIQKARGQRFFSGYHQYDLDSKAGAIVYPSVQAQSAYAHLLSKQEVSKEKQFLLGIKNEPYNSPIPPGSVLFLMGPPGAFKQFIATNFCAAVETKSAIYISFKADLESVRHQMSFRTSNEVSGTFDSDGVCNIYPLEQYNDSNRNKPTTWFLDARSPLLTPEEILCKVRRTIIRPSYPSDFGRAVVWGLRRLTDMPNFAGGKAVQFLEALVTLLKASGITSLLVDWPDPDKPNVLPIVDLSQYILLAQSCKAFHELKRDTTIAEKVWYGSDTPDDSMLRERVVLLRIQRDKEGFHRNKGFLIYKCRNTNKHSKPKDITKIEKIENNEFELWWQSAGISWKNDPSLGY